ncbi:RHS repeat domain-containing protein, partial [Fulvivirga aurantia]|uniref:RHS repeat domain-containing protein n=1 Tax=Fulvivirga aurantia TaxID=2529383 RepID=UPI0016292839
HDFYSGQVKKRLIKDEYGNFEIESIFPAYEAYSGMGLAINRGKNMLTQERQRSTTLYSIPQNILQYQVSLEPSTCNNCLWSLRMEDGMQEIMVNDHFLLYLDDQPYFFKVEFVGDNSLGIRFDGKLPYSVEYENVEIKKLDKSLLASSVQTWSNQIEEIQGNSNVYRKHRSYSYLGNNVDVSQEPNGLYPYSSFVEFDGWQHGQTPSSDQWQKNSEITLYDVNSHALEAMDVNGNYAATHMDVDYHQVFSTAANAQYHEFGYSGFEKMRNDFRFSGDIKLGVGDAGLRQKSDGYKTHTGEHSVEVVLDGGTALYYDFPEVDRSKDYRLSVWVHEANKNQLQLYAKDGSTIFASFNGDDLVDEKKAGEWYLANLDVSLEGTTGDIQFGVKSSGGTGLTVDDFRFHPLDATMTSYVYNEWGELSHILDANNIYTHYEYDEMGRLIRTHRETFDHETVQTGLIEYNYGKQDIIDDLHVIVSAVDDDTYKAQVNQGYGPFIYTWKKNGNFLDEVTTNAKEITIDIPDQICGFEVSCEIQDTYGRKKVATYRNSAPYFSASGSMSGNTASVSLSGGKPPYRLTYNLTNADGSTKSFNFRDITSNNHTNTFSGLPSCYKMNITARDACGTSKSQEIHNTLFRSVDAIPYGTWEGGQAGTTLTFEVAVNSGCEPYDYEWSYENTSGVTYGILYNQPSVDITFENCGSFTVKCKVTAENGKYDQVSQFITISGDGSG